MARKSAPAHDLESLEPFDPARLDLRLRATYLLRKDAPDGPWRASCAWQVRSEDGVWQEAYRAGEVARTLRPEGLMAIWFRSAFQIWMRFDGASPDDVYRLCAWEAAMKR